MRVGTAEKSLDEAASTGTKLDSIPVWESIGMVVLLYVVPTAAEVLAGMLLYSRYSLIIAGDLLGCVWLGVVFRMPRRAAALYLALSGIESWLYFAHLVHIRSLVWFEDLVPTAVCVAVLFRSARQARQREAADQRPV